MEDQFYPYQRKLEDELFPLGFSIKKESSQGLGQKTTFVKDTTEISLLYDMRNNLIILRAYEDKKRVGKTSEFQNKESLEKHFANALKNLLKNTKAKIPDTLSQK